MTAEKSDGPGDAIMPGAVTCCRCQDSEAAPDDVSDTGRQERLRPGAIGRTRPARLLQRLLDAAATSLATGDLEPARSTAEEVRAVDPDNRRAAEILRAVAARQLGPSGERALMTLLFSDLVGSTVPEGWRSLLAAARDDMPLLDDHGRHGRRR